MNELEFLDAWKNVEPAIASVLRSRRVFGEDLTDLIAEARMKCWRFRHQRDDRPFKTWAIRIACNAHLDALRMSSRRIQALSYDALEQPDMLYGIAVEMDPLADAMPQWMHGMPRTLKQALLYSVSGLNSREMALALGCTIPAARCRLYRARAWAINRLKDENGKMLVTP